jgi:hypothetical protein
MKAKAIPGLIVASLACVGGGVALIIGSASNTSPSKAEMQQALERAMDRIAPASATLCGLVKNGAERSEALRCVREHIARKSSFAVAFQERGEDSDVWSGLVGDSLGQMQWLTFDSSPGGKPQRKAEYLVTAVGCSSPVLRDTGPSAISCLQPEKT